MIRLLHDHGVLLEVDRSDQVDGNDGMNVEAANFWDVLDTLAEVLDCNGRTPLHLACEHGRFEAFPP